MEISSRRGCGSEIIEKLNQIEREYEQKKEEKNLLKILKDPFG